MEKPKKNSKTKNYKQTILFAVALIIMSISYFVFSVKSENAYAFNVKTKESVNNMVLPDSAKIKLQNAIDLVSISPGEANYINLSLEYFNNAMYVECIQATQKALEYNANSYVAYNNMCAAYNSLGKWDKAITAGKNALTIIPSADLATNNLQISFDGKAQLDKDIANAEALVVIAPSENNYTNLGYLYYQANKFELSVSTYKKVIEINKNNVIAYNNICSAYNELGRWADAIEYCEKALAVDSAFLLSKNNLLVAKSNYKK